MDKLTKARQDIDEIDTCMAKLFIRRMQAAEVIAAHKASSGLPVTDVARETALTERLCGTVPDVYKPYYRSFLTSIITESKRYQTSLLSARRIAYAGEEGAFAHIAAARAFPGEVYAPFPDFASAYNAVLRGDCEAAVLPIENSYAGDVDRVMDLAFRGSLSISGIYSLPLDQALLVRPGVRMTDIREVRSHPQALAQCRPFLDAHGWALSEAPSTASAARSLALSDRTDLAVLASGQTASLYGLEVLSETVNESRTNTTRFAVFTSAEACAHPGDKHFVLMFNTQNRPGALGEAISVIGGRNFNLRCLKSHPTGDANWAYYFYTEGDGDLSSEAGQRMLADLGQVCSRVRLLGSFVNEITL